MQNNPSYLQYIEFDNLASGLLPVMFTYSYLHASCYISYRDFDLFWFSYHDLLVIQFSRYQ